MRRGNLPDGGHDKVTWKHIRDLLTRLRDNVTLRRGLDVPQRCYWVFKLGLTGETVGAYWWDVMDTYHWDVLVTYQWDAVRCFIWDLFETCGNILMRRCCYVLLRRRHDVPIRYDGDVPSSWRRSIETSSGVSFETYLRRRWDMKRDVVPTSPRRLVAGWAVFLDKHWVLGRCSAFA